MDVLAFRENLIASLPGLGKLFVVCGLVVICGFAFMYGHQVLIILNKVIELLGEFYYRVFGKRVRAFQTKFSRHAALSDEKDKLSRFYRFYDEIILNLNMKKDSVTVSGLLLFLISISVAASLILCYLFGSLKLLIPLIGVVFYLLTVLFQFVGLSQHEKRELAIMDATDLLVSDYKDGIFNAVIRYRDSFPVAVRPYFESFLDDISHKGYSFTQAMRLLNDRLGPDFTDFAEKAILYEGKADDSLGEIFSSVIEMNRQKRTQREILSRFFLELRIQLIVSVLIIAGYAVLSAVFDPAILAFLLGSNLGNYLLIADLLLIAFILARFVAIKAKSFN